MTTTFDSIRPHLPKTGWLARYVELTDGLAACPRFRFFAAVSVLGAAINNKISLKRGTTGVLFPKFFPNPWILLLAPPGQGYKTSTISMVCNVLVKALPEARVISDKITPEAIVQALSSPKTEKEKIRIGPRDATGLIKASELSVFFGKQQYNTSLVSLITDLYDYREVWHSETIGRGKETLRNNCLSILGGSTPSWLQSMLPQDAFTGGFMSRFVIVEMPPSYYKRVAFPTEPPPEHWKEVIADLADIGHISGDMEWTPGALEAYKILYESYRPVGDPQLDAYRERESEHTLKLGMLLALSHKSLVLEAHHLKTAQNLIEALDSEVNVRIERLSTHPRMSLTQEVKDLLRFHGQLTEKELLSKTYRFLHLGEAQFYEAIGILKRTGQIIPTKHKDGWIFTLVQPKKEIPND